MKMQELLGKKAIQKHARTNWQKYIESFLLHNTLFSFKNSNYLCIPVSIFCAKGMNATNAQFGTNRLTIIPLLIQKEIWFSIILIIIIIVRIMLYIIFIPLDVYVIEIKFRENVNQSSGSRFMIKENCRCNAKTRKVHARLLQRGVWWFLKYVSRH